MPKAPLWPRAKVSKTEKAARAAETMLLNHRCSCGHLLDKHTGQQLEALPNPYPRWCTRVGCPCMAFTAVQDV